MARGEGYADPYDRSARFGVFRRDWDPARYGRDAGTEDTQQEFVVLRRRGTGRKTYRLTPSPPPEFANPPAARCSHVPMG